MTRILVLISAALTATACVNLKTRSDLRGDDGEPQKQTRAQQQREFKEPKAGMATARVEEVDEQMRQLNGRLEAIENQLNQMNAAQAGEKQSVTEMAKYTDQKFSAYEEELKKLREEITVLNDELARLKAAPAATSSATGGGSTKSKSAFEEGEELFANKKWREAIVAYQKYRDANPKGKLYPDATYKIGVCFQELKMKDEARAFFDEVVAKFPSSKEAKKAAFRLKSVK